MWYGEIAIYYLISIRIPTLQSLRKGVTLRLHHRPIKIKLVKFKWTIKKIHLKMCGKI